MTWKSWSFGLTLILTPGSHVLGAGGKGGELPPRQLLKQELANLSHPVGRAAVSIPDEQNRQVPEAVITYLAHQQLVLDTLLATSSNHWALGARRKSSGARYLVALDVSASKARPLVAPVPLAEFEPYPAAKWFSYHDAANDGLWYAFDASSEGLAESRVFEVKGGGLRRTFQDRTTCKPAEVRQVQDRLLLLSYTEWLDSECEAECPVLIREDTGIQPAWISVLEWKDGAWRPIKVAPPALLRDIADGYRKVRRYVAASSAKGCARRKDAVLRKLDGWAARANHLAESGG